VLVKKLKYSVLVILKLLNILSLDAPLVVLFWTEIISIQFEVSIPLVTKLIFFLSTWLGYSADRFLESFSKKPDFVIGDRHLFFLRNKKIYCLTWITIFVVSVNLAVHNFSNLKLFLCFGLFILVILNQIQSVFRSTRIELMFPKNIRTSLLLSLTCFYLPILFSNEFSIEILLSFLILGILFFINCLKIKLWEESNKYFKSPKDKLFENQSFEVSTKLRICLLSLLLFSIIIFEQKLYLILFSIVLTVLFSVLLDRAKIKTETKIVFLDQLFWMVPFLILIQLWQ
jgi:hypothetical protein